MSQKSNKQLRRLTLKNPILGDAAYSVAKDKLKKLSAPAKKLFLEQLESLNDKIKMEKLAQENWAGLKKNAK